jgi:oligopeptide/dipeptide ABC transporter ATP-binding protein
MFISHDLSLVRYFCDTMVVMYLGKIVESGPTEEIFANPRHPYTQALISAIPVVEPGAERDVIVLQGEPPSSFSPPSGCHFHPRCQWQKSICRSTYPEIELVGQSNHFAACHFVQEIGHKQ